MRTLTLSLPLACILAALSAPLLHAAPLPPPVELTSGWQLQDSSKVPEPGTVVSSAAYQPQGWLAATVPGTVLTALVNNHVYPEPLYAENNRTIPESLNKTSWWYRAAIPVPRSFAHRQVALRFDGANFTSQVWVNGTQVGTIQGAFTRGRFDISSLVKPGETAIVAVRVTPQPHPGIPHEHTIANGLGLNGGVTAIDGPTFLSTIGWDWLAAVRDRDTGLWQKVTLVASGPVLVEDPLVTTTLPLPSTSTADLTIRATLENTTAKPQKGTLAGSFGDVHFEQNLTLAPHSKQGVTLDPQTTAALHLANPKLWWPNGYGPQNLYTLHLEFRQGRTASSSLDTPFGIRTITYDTPGAPPVAKNEQAPDSDSLTITVNGVKIFIRGGDWGLDEALKRIPRARLDAEIHMHQLAHLNMIRNWVGQSTSEDFYQLCDKYGILIWDEFFQPNPSDGPNPDDLQIYLANVRDKILRFRNHPSIALWCARNEGYPPPAIDQALRAMIPALDPARLYQPSSTAGRGVVSAGPYYWREPRAFYAYDAPFKTETGTVSIPTLDSVHGMLAPKDWETINDDWAEHDLAKGAQHGDTYPYVLRGRYGRIANLADFVRKAQLMNYEAYRAMYEGRNARLFAPNTGILTWMSHPAQPSFVWQLYHYDLEPNSSLFAVQSASEPIHIQLNESTGILQVINNTPEVLTGATAHLSLLNLDGSSSLERDYPVTAPSDFATSLGPLPQPVGLSEPDSETELISQPRPDSVYHPHPAPADVTDGLGPLPSPASLSEPVSQPQPKELSVVYFVKLELRAQDGTILSRNLYWKPKASQGEDLAPLGTLPTVELTGKLTRHDSPGTAANPDTATRSKTISYTIDNSGAGNLAAAQPATAKSASLNPEPTNSAAAGSTANSATARLAAARSIDANSTTAKLVTARSKAASSTIARLVTARSAAAGSAASNSTTAGLETARSIAADFTTAHSATAYSATAHSATADSAIADSATSDSATAYSAIADSATSNSATADSATAYSATADSATSNSATADSATSYSAIADSATSNSATSNSATSNSATSNSATSNSPTDPKSQEATANSSNPSNPLTPASQAAADQDPTAQAAPTPTSNLAEDTLAAQALTAHDTGPRLLLDLTLTNPAHTMALMAHIQLRRKSTGERVLPVFYSANYISLAPGESRTLTIDAALSDLHGDTPLVTLDGWNTTVAPLTHPDSALETNVEAEVSHWPATGLPMSTAGLPGKPK